VPVLRSIFLLELSWGEEGSELACGEFTEPACGESTEPPSGTIEATPK